MKIKKLVIGLSVILLLSGCSRRTESVQAFDGLPMPTLAMPVHSSEKAGPLVVTPTRVALGKEIEVKVEDIKADEMAGLGIALLDPTGAKLQTITPVQPLQKLTVPADGKPGAYKVWLAGSSFAASSGVNLVVVDVYDDIPVTLRNPDPLKIVETYFTAVGQKNYVLAWQTLSAELSSSGRTAWTRSLESTVQSIRLIKTTPQQVLKPTDQSYRCLVELEIKPRANGVALGTATRTNRHVAMRKESGGWRIERISMLP